MISNIMPRSKKRKDKISKKKPEYTKAVPQILKSDKYKSLINEAINTINTTRNKLMESGYSYDDADLFVKQRYVHNLQTFSDPVNGAIALLADLKTRIDIDAQINPDPELVGSKYLRLLEEMRKTLKLVNEMKQKIVTHRVQFIDDNVLDFDNFIDAETEEEIIDAHHKENVENGNNK